MRVVGLGWGREEELSSQARQALEASARVHVLGDLERIRASFPRLASRLRGVPVPESLPEARERMRELVSRGPREEVLAVPGDPWDDAWLAGEAGAEAVVPGLSLRGAVGHAVLGPLALDEALPEPAVTVVAPPGWPVERWVREQHPGTVLAVRRTSVPLAEGFTVETAGVARAMSRLADVMARLRGPAGCPWDRRQTHISLLPYLLEETHEVMEAVEADLHSLAEELGDLLLQVVFHAEIAREDGRFHLGQVAEGLVQKLVRRHPHVFAGEVYPGDEAFAAQWEVRKAEEKARSGTAGREVPPSLPALAAGWRLAARGRRGGRLAGGREELTRRAAELLGQGGDEEVLGELLWTICRLAESDGVDPEGALRRRLRTLLAAWGGQGPADPNGDAGRQAREKRKVGGLGE